MTGYKIYGTIATLYSGFLIILIAVSFLTSPAVAYAAEITYAGDKKQLQETPVWFQQASSYAIFPGTKTAPRSSGNKVTVNYSEAHEVTNPNFVFGGLSKSGDVSGNSVVLLNGRSNKIFGGWSSSGVVSGNTVTISGNFVVENGGTRDGWHVQRDIYGGWSDSGKVTGNTVTISGGLVTGTSGGSVYGGRSGTGISKGNAVVISGGSVDGDVSGGKSDQGDATDNVVTMNGGVVTSIFGCYSGRGSALRNAVTISDGSVGWAVYGGYCYSGSASGNTVTISGGSVRENVYGGYGQIPSTATGNTVTISGKPKLTKSQIFGGYVFGGYSGYDAFTGNTLNLKSNGISVATVGNFEYYNFYLPQNLTAGGVMLNATKPADLSIEPLDLKGTTVAIFLQGSTKLRKGGKIVLIKSAAGIENSPKNKSCQVKHDGALYEFSIYTDKNNLWAQVTKVGNNAK